MEIRILKASSHNFLSANVANFARISVVVEYPLGEGFCVDPL